jgi:hypothetical protein
MADSKPPATRHGGGAPASVEMADRFLVAVKARRAAASGRLIFALDATASRQPTWDAACALQAEMFREVTGLDVQLIYYRGESECQASRWFSDAASLAKAMARIVCEGGCTQIGRVLAHACKSENRAAVLVFVGDAMEENPDKLISAARRLGCPVFIFQEGDDPDVERVFQGIARASGGAYCRFDPGAARQLAELLRAVAIYAAGGATALAARKDAASIKLLAQLGK